MSIAQEIAKEVGIVIAPQLENFSAIIVKGIASTVAENRDELLKRVSGKTIKVEMNLTLPDLTK